MALKLKGSTSGFVAVDCAAEGGNNTLILPSSNGVAGAVWANNVDTAGVATCTSITINKNGDLTVPGTVSVGGTITYEDVTNVDSVGIITARTDIHLGDKLVHYGDTNTAIRFPAADTITAETGGSERLRITSEGEVLINEGSARSYVDGAGYTQTPKLQVEADDNTSSAISLTYNSAAGAATRRASFMFARTADGTAVSNNSVLGEILFMGEGNSTQEKAASIRAEVDGTPGTNDMPGRLVFSTSADGSDSPTERLRIAADGKVGVGTDNPATYPLEIWNDTSAALMIRKGSTSRVILSNDASYNSFYSQTAAGAARDFVIKQGTDEVLRISSDGHVGIGTDNPNQELVIGSSAFTNIVMVSGRSNATDQIGGLSFKSSALGITTATMNALVNGTMLFKTAGEERMRITEAGDMGLGITDPDRQLHIRGTAPIIRFSDTGGGYSEISANTAILSLRADAGNTQSSSYVDVQIDGALKAKFDSTGDLTISDGDLVIGTGGHGIDFSAQTPASGMTAELLDHYEEGSWTPALNGGVTATAQQCQYTRIGKQVFIIGKLKTWSTSTLDTDIQITGLPFTPASDGGTGPTVWHKGGDMGDHPTCARTANAGYIRFLKSGSGSGAWGWVEYEDLNSTATEVYFSVAYPVA